MQDTYCLACITDRMRDLEITFPILNDSSIGSGINFPKLSGLALFCDSSLTVTRETPLSTEIL